MDKSELIVDVVEDGEREGLMEAMRELFSELSRRSIVISVILLVASGAVTLFYIVVRRRHHREEFKLLP